MKNLVAVARLAFVVVVMALVGFSSASAGNHIPKAEIIVVKQGTNERFVVQADDSGSFSFSRLPAGDYTMSIVESSFNRAIAAAGAGSRASADYYLKISSSRAPINPVSVRRFFAGIPVSVGSDGVISGTVSYAGNVTSPRDAGSGMASGK